MQGRKPDVRWTLVFPVFALAAVMVVFFSRGTGEAPAQPQAQTDARAARISETLGAREFRGAPQATLAESLRAADLLVRAGKLTPPPTLAESLQAADLLVKAGKLTPPPTLAESLRAADLLAKAGVIAAPPPTLAESLRAADLLVKAGIIAAPPPSLGESILAAAALANAGVITPPTPPLIEILRAAAMLAEAQAARQAADAAPPAAPAAEPTVAQPARAVAATGASSGGYYDDSFSAQVFSLVNQRRRAAGLRPLGFEPRLASSAAAYTKVLADNNWFSHTGPDGSTLVTRDEAAGFPFTVQLGEVLAWGSNGWTAAEIVQAWIDSPAHREQILSPAYTRAGAGCYFTREATLMVRCSMELAAG